MKVLACKDVSGIECGYTAEAETDDEIKAMLMGHGDSAHADIMAGVTEEQKAEMAKKMGDSLASQ